MEASVYINSFVPPWLWDGRSSSTASNVGQCSHQGALPDPQLPPSWWEEQLLESFQSCFSGLSGTELLCSPALLCGAASAEPAQTSHGIRLHIVVFVRFVSHFLISHIDVCCAVWSPVFTAVFYENSQGFIDGSFLFVIWASIWL